MDSGRKELIGIFMSKIIVLVKEDLDIIYARESSPGQLGRSLLKLSRLVDSRLIKNLGFSPQRQLGRLFGDEANFLSFILSSDSRLAIEFGVRFRDGRRTSNGFLHARWDGIGVAGPYRIEIKGAERSVNDFCEVLELYLHLPEL